MVDLNDVALFVQVVRAGSFAEAGRRTGLPSNSVSRRIQGLEAQLGLRLLHRSTRRLTLTDAGENLYTRCAEQVEVLSEATAELAQGSQSPGGRVRMAAPADFFNWFLMDWVAVFLAAHPRVRLDFVLSDSRADLAGEGIDVALRAGRLHEPALVARRIGTSRQSLVASPAYLAARGTPQALEDLQHHDCLVMTDASGRARWRLEGPQGPHEIPVSGRLQANSAQALAKAAVAGLGIALLPEIMAAPHLERGELQPLLPGFGTASADIHLVYLSRRQMPRAVASFIDFVVERAQAHGIVASTLPPAPDGAVDT
jgi:LysR family transcriptional regulator AphB